MLTGTKCLTKIKWNAQACIDQTSPSGHGKSRPRECNATIPIVPPVETMGQSSVAELGSWGKHGAAGLEKGDQRAVQMHAVHRRRRCIDALSTFRALVPVSRRSCRAVHRGGIGDISMHIIMEGPCSISHVTRRVIASHGRRLRYP